MTNTIPKLVYQLNYLGIQWVGPTTRRGPLEELIETLHPRLELTDSEVKEACQLLKDGDKTQLPLPKLVAIMRILGITVTSEEVKNPVALQQRVIDEARTRKL